MTTLMNTPPDAPGQPAGPVPAAERLLRGAAG